MADTDPDFTVELFGPLQSDGWAVVHREAGLPRWVIAVYLTRAQAEAATERFQKEAAKNI